MNNSESEFGFRIEGVGRPYVIKPWIGVQYSSERLRIMVHGDSYYATSGDNSLEAWRKLAEERPKELESATSDQIECVIKAYQSGAQDQGSHNLRKTLMYRV